MLVIQFRKSAPFVPLNETTISLSAELYETKAKVSKSSFSMRMISETPAFYVHGSPQFQLSKVALSQYEAPA
jgi:hypothetical protein